ncbi:hypothetical protein BsWGS_04532 [Bradybaena similaris]
MSDEELKWSTSYDFIGMYICNIFGLSQVWRFQNAVYTNGGGAFLIPYTVCFFCLAAPLMLLEYTLGQYTNASPLKCWEFCPIFSGCGVSMMLLSGSMAVVYPVFVAWSFYFFYTAFATEVPWTKCGSWSTPSCFDNVIIVSRMECLMRNWSVGIDGHCLQDNNTRSTFVWDLSLAKTLGFDRRFPAEEYLDRVVVREGDHNIFNLGSVRMPIVLALILIWAYLWLFLVKGLHVSAKVFIWSMSLPTVILVALLVRGLLLDGSWEGVLFYILPDVTEVHTLKIWKDAALQVLFTSSVGLGGQIVLARYNDFHLDLIGSILIIFLATILCNVIVGIMTFSYAGFMAKQIKERITRVIRNEPTSAFKIILAALSKLEGSTLWSIAYLFMVNAFSLGSQILYLETFISCILDIKPELTKNRAFVLTGVCLAMFILSIPMTTQGGQDITNLIVVNITLNTLGLAMCDCISIGWIYGTDRFLDDLGYMIGKRCCKFCNFGKIPSLWFKLCWKIISPCLILLIFFSYSPTIYGLNVPLWGNILSSTFTFSCTVIIILMAIFKLTVTSGIFMERLIVVCSPTENWNNLIAKKSQQIWPGNMIAKRSRQTLSCGNLIAKKSRQTLSSHSVIAKKSRQTLSSLNAIAKKRQQTLSPGNVIAKNSGQIPSAISSLEPQRSYADTLNRQTPQLNPMREDPGTDLERMTSETSIL